MVDSIFQLFFKGKKSNEQDESQITEEFNVTNTFELNQELEKEPNLEYNYEEEEEDEEKEEKKEEINNNKENGKEDEYNIINVKEENKKEEKKEDKKEIKDSLQNLGNEYIEDDGNIISTKINEEENKNSEKIEVKKEPIIEEIDTTVPKNNPEENNSSEHNDENMIFKEINQNTICHRLILKGSDIDITEKVYFKCYKLKTKSNVISFITGSKKVKIPYIIILDENFYYMIKDKPVNDKNENIRRVGNRYDLTKISNFQTRKVDEDYEFAFEFMYEDYFDRIYKLLYFEKKDAELFFDVFQQYSDNLGLDLHGNIMGSEDSEGKEEEDEGEEGEEGEEKEDNEENAEEEDEKEGGEEDNKDIKEKDENNIDNKKDELETNSTKEESKEIREVEITN